VAALHALRVSGEDPILLVLPADHVIRDVPALHGANATARRQAEAGKLVTFGIVPTEAHTGYGYIRAGRPVAGGASARAVAEFTEKPDPATAERHVASGEHYWNSGMFLQLSGRG
jgi:mannose-1-phosphate guanylyltransferase